MIQHVSLVKVSNGASSMVSFLEVNMGSAFLLVALENVAI